MGKVALITGITGQDGSYLADLLLEKGYEVHGVVRQNSTPCMSRIEHLFEKNGPGGGNFCLHYGDLMDSSCLASVIAKTCPDEVYNLAAQSHVGVSFQVPEYTAEITGIGTLKLLEAVRQSGLNCRYYQASTSELFGGIPGTTPQSETTPFYPKSPYAAAKLYAYWITVNYRESYGIFACNGILFNHESPRRGENFVTRKITLAIANIMAGNQEKLSIGNMDARRDWGYAGDYVEGMWRILQMDKPADYVLATNESHTVREFVEAAFEEVGICIRWEGNGIEEKGYDAMTGRLLVDIDPQFFRPAEVEMLWGNPAKAETELNWKRKVAFRDLVHMMVQSDMKCVAGVEADELRKRNLWRRSDGA